MAKKKKSTTYLIDKAQVKLGMALETTEFGIMGALCGVCVCVPMHMCECKHEER